MSGYSSTTCTDAEDLLVRRTYETLPALDTASLQAHLHNCPQCSALAATMRDMQHSLTADVATLLSPDPAIKCLLDARLLAIQPVAVSGWLSRWTEAMWSFVKPVCGYQLAGAAALALFLVFAVNHAPLRMAPLQELPAITADSMGSIANPDSEPDSLQHLEDVRQTSDDSILILLAGQSI